MEYQDYYKTLGVEKTASEDDIRSSYRKLAMKYHPDTNQGDKAAEEKFKDINEAYQVLSDKDKRAKYDQLGSAYNQWQQYGGQQGGFAWDDWFSPGAGGQRVHVDTNGNFEEMFGGMGGFSDFFSSIFGGMGGFGQGQSQPRGRGQGFGHRVNVRDQGPQKIEQELPISLYEAYFGSTRQFDMGDKRLEVKIPPGAATGKKIRMSGAGPRGSNGRNQDVYLKFRVYDDPRFTRDGNDLYTDVRIDLFSAVLGGEVNVPTVKGQVSLTIPEGTQPGQTFRLKGQGMPHWKNKEKFGDLYAKVNVSIPKKLSKEEKELFEKLAEIN